MILCQSRAYFFRPKKGSTKSFWRNASQLRIFKDKTIHVVHVHVFVYWVKPLVNIVALNIDGVSVSSLARGGGIIRDCKRNHIENLFCYYGKKSKPTKY